MFFYCTPVEIELDADFDYIAILVAQDNHMGLYNSKISYLNTIDVLRSKEICATILGGHKDALSISPYKVCQFSPIPNLNPINFLPINAASFCDCQLCETFKCLKRSRLSLLILRLK